MRRPYCIPIRSRWSAISYWKENQNKALKRALLLIAVATTPAPHSSSTLDTVRSKGFVQCGVNTGIAGFSLPIPRACTGVSTLTSAVRRGGGV